MNLSDHIFEITNNYGDLILFLEKKFSVNQSDFGFFILTGTYKFLNFGGKIIIVRNNSASILLQFVASFFALLDLHVRCVVS